MNIILLGPPGCGKGTQSSMLVEHMGLSRLSSGDLVREKISSGGEEGKVLGEIVASGHFPSDRFILDLVFIPLSALIQEQQGVIFDGFPRTVGQAREMDKFLRSKNSSISAVVELQVPEEVLFERIKARYSCALCHTVYNEFSKRTKVEGVCDVCHSKEFTYRVDDQQSILKERLEVYKEQTIPLVAYYRERKILFQIDGTREVSEVFQEIKKKLSLCC